MTMGTISDETKNIIGMDVKPSVMVDWARTYGIWRKNKKNFMDQLYVQ